MVDNNNNSRDRRRLPAGSPARERLKKNELDDARHEAELLDVAEKQKLEQALHKSDIERKITAHNARSWAIKWLSRFGVCVICVAGFIVLALFAIYAWYIIQPAGDVIRPNGVVPTELVRFLGNVWEILSNGVIVAALTQIVPRLFK